MQQHPVTETATATTIVPTNTMQKDVRRTIGRPTSCQLPTTEKVTTTTTTAATRKHQQKQKQMQQVTKVPKCLCCFCVGCCTCPKHDDDNKKTTTKEIRKANEFSRKQMKSRNVDMNSTTMENSNGCSRKNLQSSAISLSSCSSTVLQKQQKRQQLPTTNNNKQPDNHQHHHHHHRSRRRKDQDKSRHSASSLNLMNDEKVIINQSHQSFKNCAKCLIIAKFTSIQAQLATQAAAQHKQNQSATSSMKTLKCPINIHNHDHDTTTVESAKKLDSKKVFNNSSEISSLTGGSGSSRNSSNWSLSSCSDDDNNNINLNQVELVTKITDDKQQQQVMMRIPESKNRQVRRPAPLPPPPPPQTNSNSNRNDPNNNRNYEDKQINCKKQQQNRCDRIESNSNTTTTTTTNNNNTTIKTGPDYLLRPKGTCSIDSGNTSETSRYCDESSSYEANHPNQQQQQQLSSVADNENDSKSTEQQQQKVHLLSELEIYSLEHSLRSLKSSTYVCGCLANLYLTNTCLANNGRHSRPTSWQLSRTGVPVLTFDSGLTRNRDKRRLCINLAERGSGFILWSDVIDHLSNYRAYSTQVDEGNRIEDRVGGAPPPACDTFHVMYLSSNHRLMVGLSFDDAHCARLFLKQVELITSDPANISLTGPKRTSLASMNRLKLVMSVGGGSNKRAKKFTKTPQVSDPSPSTCMMTTAMSVNCLSAAAANGSINYIHQADQPQARNGWSTLKRVMRYGQRRAGLMMASSSASIGAASENAHTSTVAIAGWLRPRPLASLAAAGRNFKRPPRKCDISAPCLFEHITSVNSFHLEQLYSRSLLIENDPSTTKPPIKQGNSHQSMMSQSLCDLASSTIQRSEVGDDDDGDSHAFGTKRMISAQVASNNQQTIKLPEEISINKQHHATTRSKESRSTSSSCYSSASISPASSDESADSIMRHSMSIARPAPPVPPMRRTPAGITPPPPLSGNRSRNPDLCEENSEKVTQLQQQQQPGGKKVKAIIRELQAQTSSDLIDAKRTLMADIAAQAAARHSRSVSRL